MSCGGTFPTEIQANFTEYCACADWLQIQNRDQKKKMLAVGGSVRLEGSMGGSMAAFL